MDNPEQDDSDGTGGIRKKQYREGGESLPLAIDKDKGGWQNKGKTTNEGERSKKNEDI